MRGKIKESINSRVSKGRENQDRLLYIKDNMYNIKI